MMPLIPSPGIPKMVSTPQSISVSTITSLAVCAIALSRCSEIGDQHPLSKVTAYFRHASPTPTPILRSRCNECGVGSSTVLGRTERNQASPFPMRTALPNFSHSLQAVQTHIQDGRFQRSLALLTAGSSLASGLQVSSDHYKASHSNPVIYTPVLLSGVLTVTALGGFFSRRA